MGPQSLQLFPVALGRVQDGQAEPDDGVFGGCVQAAGVARTAQHAAAIGEVDAGSGGRCEGHTHTNMQAKGRWA